MLLLRSPLLSAETVSREQVSCVFLVCFMKLYSLPDAMNFYYL